MHVGVRCVYVRVVRVEGLRGLPCRLEADKPGEV